MVFYLDNNDKFLLDLVKTELIFILYSDVMGQPMKSSTRWVNINIFKQDHLLKIFTYLKSEDIVNSKIGKTMLEQSLKLKIHGDIVGFREN